VSKGIEKILKNVGAFENELTEILSAHEGSNRRTITLDGTLKKLESLTVRQKTFFREAIVCMKHDLFRASHVMAWIGFIDFFLEKICSNNCNSIKSYGSTKYNSVSNPQELREETPSEHQQIVLGKSIRFINEKTKRALIALLDKRNDCAHSGSSTYKASLNSSLAYVNELFDYIDKLKNKSP